MRELARYCPFPCVYLSICFIVIGNCVKGELFQPVIVFRRLVDAQIELPIQDYIYIYHTVLTYRLY